MLLNDNHTVILLLFSGFEDVSDDSCLAFRTMFSRRRDDRSLPPQRAVTSSVFISGSNVERGDRWG